MEYSYYLRRVNKRTMGKYDTSTLTHDPEVFRNLVKDLARPFRKLSFDVVAAQESLGFVLGSSVAYELGKGFVPIRKGGRLPTLRTHVLSASFTDYSGGRKRLEMNEGSVRRGDRVLLIDDWIESGAQMKAAIRLVEKQGGVVVGIGAVKAHENDGTKTLFGRYNCRPLNLE